MDTQELSGMNESQAAKKLGVSVHTLRSWRFSSKGPSYLKLGKRVVYLRQDLDDFLLSRRITPTAAA